MPLGTLSSEAGQRSAPAEGCLALHGALCITQWELAQRAGISPAVLSLLLSGRRYAGPAVRSRLLSTPLLKPLGYDGLFQVEG